MTAEDRDNELLALECIYENNLKLINSSPLQKFTVSLQGQLGDSSPVKNLCQILFEYTKDYPNEGPTFKINNFENLSAQDIETLNGLIESIIKQSLGEIMIFIILSEVQEKLNSILETAVFIQEKAVEEKRKAVILEEEAKFHGDRVTIESFLKWNTQFLGELNASQKKTNEQITKRSLTGRELFLLDNRYDDSDLTFLESDGGQVVEIDEHLFSDIGDLGLMDDLDENDQNSLQVV